VSEGSREGGKGGGDEHEGGQPHLRLVDKVKYSDGVWRFHPWPQVVQHYITITTIGDFVAASRNGIYMVKDDATGIMRMKRPGRELCMRGLL